MTFDEIPLYETIHDVYRETDKPRAERWVHEDKEELCRRIQSALPLSTPFTDYRQWLRAWIQYGKSTHKENGDKLAALIVEIARTHGRRCFWANRGKGPCANEVTIDRLVPGSRGGKYVIENCVLACSIHNTQRSDRTVEEFLREICT